MTATIGIDGVDLSSNLIRVERREEYCDPGQHIEAVFDSFISVLPWKSMVLWEDGTKVFTGNTSQIEGARPTGRRLIRGADDIKRLREYFVAEDYLTSGEGVKHWIRKFAEEAGCSITFREDYDPIPLAGMTLGRMHAYDIIDEFLLFSGWDIWCDEDGVVNVGFRMRDRSATESIAAGDNLVKMERSKDSEPSRNCAKVYAATGYATVQRTFGWEIDSNDVRTMVVSSMHVENPAHAAQLAGRMVSAAGPEYDIKRCDLNDVYPGMEIGDRATFDDGAGESGEDNITTVISTHDGDKNEQYMHIKMGERCPKVGAGGWPIDGRDVIVATYECGVWRCYDIWQDGGPVWYPLNTGLETAYPDYSVPAYGAHNCNWFIRDPFQPNDITFLLTKYGIYRTDSTDHGLENWYPVLMNDTVGTIYKIRSTVAREGQYYIVIDGLGDHKKLGLTQTRFASLTAAESYGTLIASYTECPKNGIMGRPPSDPEHLGRYNVALSSWHHTSGYIPEGNLGGLAAWHKCDWGCTVSGVSDCFSANGEGGIWAYTLITDGPYAGTAMACSVNCCAVPLGSLMGSDVFYPHQSGISDGGGAGWLTCSSIHVPYKQDYVSGGYCLRYPWTFPSTMYVSPGTYSRTDPHTGKKLWYPRKVGPAGSFSVVPPWGDEDCHWLQGSIGTYTPNPDRVYVFNGGNPSRFAISEDAAVTWTEKSSVPFQTSCFSGFPYSAAKVYAGRHALTDPTAPPPEHHADDSSLIYVTWDDGDTWHDVTGDLWTKTQALGLRVDGEGSPLGTKGIVTIAPRYA